MRLAALAMTAALAAGGCGAGTSALLRPDHRSRPASTTVPAAAIRVIRGWSQALRSGHVGAAAAYFRIPSLFALGAGPPVEIRSPAEARLANAALPCGARLISTRRAGHDVNALFRLTNRRGRGGAGGCGAGTGQTARTNFLIENGQIVEWLRAPDEPGDNGTPRTTPGHPAPPTTPTSPDTIPGGGAPRV
jgi:hypothetical protein